MKEPWISEKFEPGLVSVIVPSYNREKLIVEAMDSVWAQTYRPIELIIVDDGSTDNTREVVEKWGTEHGVDGDFHLRYFYQKNAGASAARNRGLIESRGEFIQFLDSDDLIYPERLERLVKVFKDTGADFIQTGFDGFDAETGEIIEKHYAKPNENQLELALHGVLWANTLRSAFRRALVEKIGPWDIQMTCFEDREFVERAVVLAEKPTAIRDILASTRRGGSKRVSDRLRTHEGRNFRIHCEERLVEGIRNRKNISYAAKQAFASRLYALGFRSNASGWSDLGKRCGALADSLGVELDSLGRRRRMIFRCGALIARAYKLAHYAKEFFGRRKLFSK